MPTRTVKVEGQTVSFNIEPFMVGDKRRGYKVADSKQWNGFRISTLTKADAVISELIRRKLPKGTVVTDIPVSPGKRRKLAEGEAGRIRKRSADAGVELSAKGAIPDDAFAKFNDEAWMAGKDAD